MADSKIKVNQDELNKVANNLSKRIADLTALNNRLQNLINRMDSSWSGTASEAYIAMMTSYLNEAKHHITLLTEFKSYIENISNSFSTWDKSSSAEIRKV